MILKTVSGEQFEVDDDVASSLQDRLKPKTNFYYNKVGGHVWFYDVDNGHTYVHRWIYKNFVAPLSDGWEVHHKDENKLNNKRDNYEAVWATQHVSTHKAGSGELKEKYITSFKRAKNPYLVQIMLPGDCTRTRKTFATLTEAISYRDGLIAKFGTLNTNTL